MDGVLIIDKPVGPTSHDVVNRVRRIFKTRKVGHTGTLDPFATGVMVVLIGKATRLARFADRADKEYEATLRFGFATDTGDLTGTQIGEHGRSDISSQEIEGVLDRFRGKIMQVPPMYSAKKVDGKKLYELARRGEEIERPAIAITIHEICLLSSSNEPSELHRIRVRCSAGTYIRTLAEDIAKALGTAAHLTELRRTASGRSSIEQSVTLDILADAAEPSKYLLPMEVLIEGLPRFVLSSDRVQKTLNGLSSRVYDASFAPDETVAMFSENNELIAIGKFVAGENAIQPTLVLGDSK
ncbi:MAG TPA: tRNA pseudouridine(55) synthase TruB [Pyrinomonadaceae bacterium]|nr:tRNA pseudouridine(55) synthase TruB [Pyrinomonadaceae bacterium]